MFIQQHYLWSVLFFKSLTNGEYEDKGNMWSFFLWRFLTILLLINDCAADGNNVTLLVPN